MKIIGYILVFAGVVNVFKSVVSESSNSNNPLERLVFGLLFVVVGGVLVKYSKSSK